LLAGELLEGSEIGYELDGWHVAAVASGSADAALRQVSGPLDCRFLLVPGGEDLTWAWFGSRRRLDAADLARLVGEACPPEAVLALGEPHRDLAGWRLSHRQALAAQPIAGRTPGRVVRYAEVSLLASALQDEVLSPSLRELYLVPLGAERDGGKALRDTLRAYFAAERNSASTAAALGITRQTVNNRLRVVEGRLGRLLGECSGELQLALALHDLDRDPSSESRLPIRLAPTSKALPT
jgi:DNA-binding PucR family transcriptional regulator